MPDAINERADFEADQRMPLPVVPTPEDCRGRTFVVTGANTGLGFECAKHLVALSAAKVILGVRSLDRGNAAKEKIEADTSIKGVAEVWEVDLGSYASVQEFVKKLSALVRVDVVIENASVALDQKTISEGLETSLTVNVVSTMLMAATVLPKLEETGKKFGGSPHLVIVGSGAGFRDEFKPGKTEGDILEQLTEGPMMGR
jgi:NAD(P)-dependent dehydrogenase (short-subunit alcohol dehydrogenase family)